MLGVVFLWIKNAEFAIKAANGIVWDTHTFFNFYFMLTEFHAAHVAAGVVPLLLVVWRDHIENIKDATAFWHMVGLIWVPLFPVICFLQRPDDRCISPGRCWLSSALARRSVGSGI